MSQSRSNEKAWGELRRYDAEAIAKLYRFRPWLLVWRTLKILFYFTSFFLGWQMDISMGKSEGTQQ